MIKSAYLSLSLFSALASTAQITISSDDMPNVKDSLYISNVTCLNEHHPAETGAGYYWDYSDLKPVSQMAQQFEAPGKFPSIYNFLFNQFNTSYGKNNPLIVHSDIAGLKFDAAYDFYKESSTSLSQVGAGYLVNGLPVPFLYKKPDVLYRFPMQYGNTDSCDFNFGLPIPDYGYYGQSGKRRNFVDGWGELKTPLGTYSTLRVLSLLDITDTVYVQQDSINGFGFSIQRPTIYEYKWFASGSKIPVLQIEGITIANHPLFLAAFIDTVRKDIIHVNVEEQYQQPLTLNIYPNPAQEAFTLQYKLNNAAAVYIAIRDVLGKEVMQIRKENQSAGTHQELMDVNMLPSGMYFVGIQAGNAVNQQKLSIVH